MDLVEMKLNELLENEKNIILGNIYGYINDDLIELYFNHENSLNLTDDQRYQLQLQVDNLLNLFFKYLERIKNNDQELNPEYTLNYFK